MKRTRISFCSGRQQLGGGWKAGPLQSFPVQIWPNLAYWNLKHSLCLLCCYILHKNTSPLLSYINFWDSFWHCCYLCLTNTVFTGIKKLYPTCTFCLLKQHSTLKPMIEKQIFFFFISDVIYEIQSHWKFEGSDPEHFLFGYFVEI